MAFTLQFAAKLPAKSSDTILVFTDNNGKLLYGATDIDKKAGGIIGAAISTRDFKGKLGEALPVFLPKCAA